MYTDKDKNLFMVIPDGMSDEEVVKLGEMCHPENGYNPENCSLKPTGYIDFSNYHASYSIYEMRTEFNQSMDELPSFSFSD